MRKSGGIQKSRMKMSKIGDTCFIRRALSLLSIVVSSEHP